MKRIILSIAAIVALTFGANAQTDQGTILLGGTIGGSVFNPDNTDDTDSQVSSFAVIPQIGYFIADDFALGLGVGYSYFETTGEDVGAGENSTVNNAFVVRPFGRYYIELGDQFSFFTELGVGLEFGGNTVTVDGNEGDTVNSLGLDIALSPGFAFFPVETFGIEFKLTGIQFRSFDPDTDVDDNTASVFNIGASGQNTDQSGFLGGTTGFFNPQLSLNFYF
ncbi:MAG: outer membrane beta-barrel protein [Bacteroidota bacterium]